MTAKARKTHHELGTEIRGLLTIITQTKRLVLRTWTLEDAPEAYAIWGDPEVMRFVGEPLADSAAAVRTLARADEAQRCHGVSLWAVVEKVSGNIIGACGFHVVEGHTELELAYHFKRSHWRRGFATEAVRACVLYATNTLATNKIIATVRVENHASHAVLENVGFQYERTERIGDVAEERFSLSAHPT